MPKVPSCERPHDAMSMGLAHCPLCVGLAILSVVRCSACGVLLWQWLRAQAGTQAPRPLAVMAGMLTPRALRPAL